MYPQGTSCLPVLKGLVTIMAILNIKISKLESDINDDALKINFYVYDVFMICSKHGTLSSDNLKCEVCSCSNYEQDMKTSEVE